MKTTHFKHYKTLFTVVLTAASLILTPAPAAAGPSENADLPDTTSVTEAGDMADTAGEAGEAGDARETGITEAAGGDGAGPNSEAEDIGTAGEAEDVAGEADDVAAGEDADMAGEEDADMADEDVAGNAAGEAAEEAAGEAPLNAIANASRPVKDAVIPAGLYTISCVKDETMVLDIAGSSSALRADLVINTKNGSASQTFMITPLGGGLYRIVNMASGRVIDIRGGSMTMRTRLQQYKHNQTPAQTFRILKYEDPSSDAADLTVAGSIPANALMTAGDPIVALAPSETDLVFDVCGGSMADGSGLQLYRFNGTEAQQFRLTPAAQPALTVGTYVIHSALNDAMVFDIPSASTTSKTTLRLWKGNYTPAQQFVVSSVACPDTAGTPGENETTGPLLISPVCSFLACDVAGGTMADGTDVRQYTVNGTAAQAWYALPNGNGTYTIASASDPSYVLDVSDGTGAKGANVAIHTRQTDGTGVTAARQSFVFEKVDANRILPDGPFKISAAADSHLVLEIQKGSFDNRANVRLHTWNDTNAQKYNLTYRGGGSYVIANARSGKVIDIAGGNCAKRTNIQQYRPNQTAAQNWQFVPLGGGSYTIVSAKDPGFCLDVAGGNIASDTNVQLYSRNSTPAQAFTLTPVRRVAEDWISSLKAAQTSYDTLIAVEATGTTATVSLHKKDAKGEWKQLLTTSGFIGANGLGKTIEGDRKTPVGVFAALNPLGIKPNPGTSLPYTQVDSTHYWVGDSGSPYYNRFVSTRTVTNFSRGLSEHIIDYGFVYNYILPIGYNIGGTPHRGSAIFLHVSRGNPTAGCVSIPESDMVTVLKNATDKTAFIIDTPQGVRTH